MKFSYLADGSKREAVNGSGGGLAYKGSLIYRKASGGALTLEGANVPEGRLLPGGVRYHVQDHLGSVRAVLDGVSGGLYAVTDYDLYGSSSANSSASGYLTTAPSGETFRYHFTGKEDQGVEFTAPYTDFGARHYAPTLRRWLVPDPMSEKYYGISPYAYCAGDPVNCVDPDGKKVRFAKGSTDIFKKRFADAVQFMNAKNTSYNLFLLEQSELVFTLSESSGMNSFDYRTRTINWNPTRLSKNDETGIIRSPVTSLAHEIGHAKRYNEAYENNDIEAYQKRSIRGSDSQYSTLEERVVITTTEQVAARRHGEIIDNEVTRYNHQGTQVIFRDIDLKDKTMLEIIQMVINQNAVNRK